MAVVFYSILSLQNLNSLLIGHHSQKVLLFTPTRLHTKPPNNINSNTIIAQEHHKLKLYLP